MKISKKQPRELPVAVFFNILLYSMVINMEQAMSLVKVPYPVLGPDAWTTDPLKVADVAFADFCLADYSQTYFYKNAIQTLSQIIQETNNQGIDITMSMIQLHLGSLLRKFFNEVSVTCSDITDTVNNPQFGIVSIYISFYDLAGTHYDMTKLAELKTSTLNQISETANGQ